MDKTIKSEAPTKEEQTIPTKKLYRLPKSGKIAGVCAGLADYLELDETLIRVIFVVLTLASGGFGILAYIILALIMPVSTTQAARSGENIDLESNFNNLTAEIRENGGVDRIKNYFGLGLVLIGVWLLLVQFFPQWISMNWNVVWPALLVILGLLLVTKGRR